MRRLWKAAAHPLSGGSSTAPRLQITHQSQNTPIDLFRQFVKLCRPEHWVKSILVILPPFFLGVIFEREMLLRVLPAFVSFSFAASAIYVVNDLADRERDKLHPVKRARPLASGAVTPRAAATLAAILAAAAFLATPFAHSPFWAATVLAIYLASNVAYSLRFKATALVDIFILAAGFVFRIFYGGFYFGTEVSSWMFLCVFSGALYFACGKRRAELLRLGSGSGSRPALGAYSADFLRAHYYMFCTLAILFYCLWTITRTDQHAVGKLALTIPVMIFIVARYNMLVEDGAADADPVPVLLHDKWLIAASLLFVFLNFVVLYLGAYLPRVTY